MRPRVPPSCEALPPEGRLWPSDHDDGDGDDDDDDDEGEDDYDDDSPLCFSSLPSFPPMKTQWGSLPLLPPDGYFHTVPYSPNLNDRLIDMLRRDATVISG